MIRNNLFYKLIALGAAIALWAHVNAVRNPQARKTVSVPIEVRNLARGYTAELPSREASVTIQGLKTVVDSVRKEDIGAWVDLERVKTSRATTAERAHVGARVLGVSEGDLTIDVSPRTVNVTVEALSSKRLPVEVKFLAAPPLGYSYSDPEISPASVGVSGRISEVVKVRKIVLPLTNISPNRPVDGYIKAVPVDSKGITVPGVTLDTDKVRLTLSLMEVPATKAVIVSPNVTGQPKFPAKVTKVVLTPSSVTLEGKPSALVEVSTITTDRVSVDGTDKTVSRDVDLNVPAGVSVIGSGKVRVTVYVGE